MVGLEVEQKIIGLLAGYYGIKKVLGEKYYSERYLLNIKGACLKDINIPFPYSMYYNSNKKV